MTGSKGKGSIRERQVEMGAEECSFFFFFREAVCCSAAMKGEDTGYSPWARERDERKRGRKLLDKGGGPGSSRCDLGKQRSGIMRTNNNPSLSLSLPPPHKHLSGSSVWRAEWGKHERRDESMHPSVCV